MSEKKPRAPRYAVKGLRVIYDTGDAFWSAPVVNISESGLFVETHHELPPGTRVTIMPDTPDELALPFEIRGVVARLSQFDPDFHWDRVPGIGFFLEGLTPENFDQLRELFRRFGVPVKSR